MTKSYVRTATRSTLKVKANLTQIQSQFSHRIQGRPQDLAGGGPRIFIFRFGNLHVAKRHAAHGEAMRFARGVRGHAPPRNLFKMVQFGVYFDHILSLKNFKNYHFLYKKYKNCNFYIKE